ncbi:50S ribosomal protein L3 [Thermoplasmatales archaeon AK]|nr:50S ribosomal protein L3 [Thermoplasmatales archaeon AK]
MATPHHSRRGSMGYYPRVRAKRQQADIRSWPEIEGHAKIQGFAGYKVGMTHVEMVDYRKYSVTAGQNLVSAVTIVEVPPLTVAGIRYYEEDIEGLRIVGEKWAPDLNKEIFRRITKPESRKESKLVSQVSEVHLIVHTNPDMVTGVPSKTPDIFEIRVGGGTVDDRIKYAESKLGKELTFNDFSSTGKFVDVIAVTKGKGFQGHVQRFGVKLLPRKNRKHRRMIGTLGPWHPDWVRNTVPMAGQMGFHQRTVHNIRVLKVAKNEEQDDINAKGGFPGYGVVRTSYVLLHGSIPGSAKRLIKFRDPARQQAPSLNDITLTYISRESKQGD